MIETKNARGKAREGDPMKHTLLFFAIACGLSAQVRRTATGEGTGADRMGAQAPVSNKFGGAGGAPCGGDSNPLALDHADRPGWWQRHLGDTAIHVGATSADAATSWGRYELNPFLRSADGRFGAPGLGKKLGIFGGVELVKWSLVRRGHRGRWVRSLSLAPAVAFGASTARNGAIR